MHGRQRKLVARAYTMDSIRKLEPAVNEVIGILMAKLKELEGQDIDLGYYLQAYAFGLFSRPWYGIVWYGMADN